MFFVLFVTWCAIAVMATMATPESFRAVYKVLDGQEIDVDIYLPQPGTEGDAGHPISMRPVWPALVLIC